MAIPARNLAPYKAKLIKLIHVAKRDLRLDDETYRRMLERLTGKTSSRDCGVTQLETVIEHMRRRGFTARPKSAESDRPARPADDPQAKMIRFLWLDLRDRGVLQDSSERALNAFIRRMTGIERLEWLDTYEASAVIEHLKKWIERVQIKQTKEEPCPTR